MSERLRAQEIATAAASAARESGHPVNVAAQALRALADSLTMRDLATGHVVGADPVYPHQIRAIADILEGNDSTMDNSHKLARVQRELMGKVEHAPSFTEALAEWTGLPVVYDRMWSNLSYRMTGEEVHELRADPRRPAYKRTGFLRHGSDHPLAYVEAVVLRDHLPPWAVFTLDSTRQTVGSVVAQLEGRRITLGVRSISEFDAAGEPLCVEVRARLDGIPVGGHEVMPLALVTEKIYDYTLTRRA